VSEKKKTNNVGGKRKGGNEKKKKGKIHCSASRQEHQLKVLHKQKKFPLKISKTYRCWKRASRQQILLKGVDDYPLIHQKYSSKIDWDTTRGVQESYRGWTRETSEFETFWANRSDTPKRECNKRRQGSRGPNRQRNLQTALNLRKRACDHLDNREGADE